MLIVNKNPMSTTAESYKTFRTNIEYSVLLQR